MRLRELFEAPQKRTAVVAFGRMNPPTIGHQKLVEALKSHNGDHYVFLSQSQKPKTDPLAFTDKLRYAKFFFPEITIGHPDIRTPMDMMAMLERLGYTDIIYVAGSDRVEGFKKLFNQYNGVPDKSGKVGYTFDSIEVVSAGERDPDADGAEGMSASKMRQAAADGDLESFTQGTPRPEVAEEMFAAVRQGMGLKDAIPAESISEGQDNTPPTTVKPVREPFPQMPEKPAEPYTTDDGETVKPTRNGGVSLGNAAGTFIWDKNGQPSMYITPSINGLKQVHNMKTGNFTVDYRNKGLNIKQQYDKNGKSIGGADTEYSMAGLTVNKDAQGNKSGTYQMGTQTVNFDPDKPFDPRQAASNVR